MAGPPRWFCNEAAKSVGWCVGCSSVVSQHIYRLLTVGWMLGWANLLVQHGVVLDVDEKEAPKWRQYTLLRLSLYWIPFWTQLNNLSPGIFRSVFDTIVLCKNGCFWLFAHLGLLTPVQFPLWLLSGNGVSSRSPSTYLPTRRFYYGTRWLWVLKHNKKNWPLFLSRLPL